MFCIAVYYLYSSKRESKDNSLDPLEFLEALVYVAEKKYGNKFNNPANRFNAFCENHVLPGVIEPGAYFKQLIATESVLNMLEKHRPALNVIFMFAAGGLSV